jgi:LPS sulfotransferase NodH
VTTATCRYIIAGTQRSGSSLLCEGLGATGIAGRPGEFFAPDFREPWFRRWGLPHDCSFGDYLAAARLHATGRNGVLGIKIQYMHVRELARWAELRGEPEDALESLFPRARYINIRRRDRLGQALSWFRAIRSNEWSRTEGMPPAPAPELEAETVRMLEEHLARQQSAWEQYFSSRGIEPLVVEYETLVEDYRTAIARVLEFLGLDGATARLIPVPRLVRQADATTTAWRASCQMMTPNPARPTK